MAKSLQEQLLKAGLTSDAKLKTAKSEKRKQEKLQRHQQLESVDEAKVLAQQTKQAQLEKDKLLNQQKAQEADKKAIAAQIKQLIDTHQLEQDSDGIAYQFTDGKLVKKIYLHPKMREQVVQGKLAIVKYEKAYFVVNLETAEKIKQRDASFILVLNQKATEVIADDPYAEYAIPDDLIW